MIKKIRFGKKFVATILTISIIGSGGIVYQAGKKIEVNRVKGYLEDFITDDNYVDLSKISSDYLVKGFSGEALAAALEEVDVRYVRINDAIIYDGAHVTPFTQVTAYNYDNVLLEDKNGIKYYEMYEPIRNATDDGVSYEIPDGFQLEEIDVLANPIRYDELDKYEIITTENDYDDSYSLILEKK